MKPQTGLLKRSCPGLREPEKCRDRYAALKVWKGTQKIHFI
jgi:hypothetical protein